MTTYADLHIPKISVSCTTMEMLMDYAHSIKEQDKQRAYRVYAGIGRTVRVPVCECHYCADFLKQAKKEGKDAMPGSTPIPIMSCTAVRGLIDMSANPYIDDSEAEKIEELIENSVTLHQCSDPRLCDVEGEWRPVDQAFLDYQQFLREAPAGEAVIETRDGSSYRIWCQDNEENKRVSWTSPYGSFSDTPLNNFFKAGATLVINGRQTSPVIKSWYDLTISEESKD